MRFLDYTSNDSPNGVNEKFDSYNRYLQSIRGQLSDNAFSFATAPWHYNSQDPRCPHDSWVESLCILEPSSGERSEIRIIEINIKLLGAYHDGYIELNYKNVHSYSLALSPNMSSDQRHGHGDWIIDEIRLSERGLILHEIEFWLGGCWVIECEDVNYYWKPMGPEISGSTA